MFGRDREKASSSTVVKISNRFGIASTNVVNGFASFKRRRTAYLVGLAMGYVDALHVKGKLPYRAILKAVLSNFQGIGF